MAKFEHGEEVVYVGFPGKPKEYRKRALYIAPDVIDGPRARHVIRIEANRPCGWQGPGSVGEDSIEKKPSER